MSRLYLLLAISICSVLNELHSQCSVELAPFVTPFTGVSADRFSFLDEAVREATIVGIGEATHGSAEFTRLTQELFLYLVERHGVRLLILEDAFGEARRINEYIAGRRDEPDIWEGNWRYYTREFTDLLLALRAYNLNHPEDPVAVYGPEMQYVHTDAAFLEDYLKGKGEDASLGQLREFSSIWGSHTNGEIMDHVIAANRVERLLTDNRNAWAEDAEYTWAIQHLNVMRQYLTALQQKTDQRKHDLRELFMLENIQWLLQHHGPDTKALFWAHNAHIQNGHHLNGNTNAIGHHLKRTYGDAYFPIITSFGEGSFLAYPADAHETGWVHRETIFERIDPATLNHCLDQMGNPHAFLDLRRAAGAPALENFLSHSQAMTGEAGAQFWGDTVVQKDLREADALIYLEQSSPINFLGVTNDKVKDYIEEFFAAVQPRALNTKQIDWAKLRATVREQTRNATTLAEVHAVLKEVVPTINKHSFFIKPSASAGIFGTELLDGELHPGLEYCEGEMLPGGIAYLEVPRIGFAHQPSLRAYADSLQRLIARLDTEATKRWIVDLRDNTGGNCWPMLAGVGPLLREGVCGYFMTPEGENVMPWSYEAGASKMSGSPQSQTTDYRLKDESPRIAVLTGGRTASAGEVVAVAFRGMNNVRSFGHSTRGYSTTNDNINLSDGGMVILTVSVYADRNKNTYGAEIEPDVAAEDALAAAIKWLMAR